MQAKTTRRQLLAGSGALSWYLIAGSWTKTTAAEARSQGYQPRVLTKEQNGALEALAETLVPGAIDAGIGPYIDSQLAAKEASLLMAKYLGVPPEQQAGFYQSALDSTHRFLQTQDATLEALVGLMGQDAVPQWQGPPASFFSSCSELTHSMWSMALKPGSLTWISLTWRTSPPEAPW